MAQVDPVALRLRDLVYAEIISNYDPELCYTDERFYDDVPIIRFSKPANSTYCVIEFFNNRVFFRYFGIYATLNLNNEITLNFQPDWTEQEIVNRIVDVILRKIRYLTTANAEYRLEPPGTHCATADLAAVFLALRGRIERLRARLQ